MGFPKALMLLKAEIKPEDQIAAQKLQVIDQLLEVQQEMVSSILGVMFNGLV